MTKRNSSMAAVVIHYQSPQTLAATAADLGAVLDRVIVIDNSSDLERTDMPGVEIVSGHGNVGYGKAANLGLRIAFASDPELERVLVTTHETRYSPSALSALAMVSKGLSAAHVLAPVLVMRTPDGNRNVWSAGGMMSLLQYPKHRRRVRPGLTRPLWVDGASFVMDRRAWEILDGVPEDFFIYMEDVALGFKCRSKGVSVYVTSASTVEQSANGPSRPLAARNRLILARRYLPRARRFMIFGEFLARTAFLRMANRTKYAENVVAWRDSKMAPAADVEVDVKAVV